MTQTEVNKSLNYEVCELNIETNIETKQPRKLLFVHLFNLLFKQAFGYQRFLHF